MPGRLLGVDERDALLVDDDDVSAGAVRVARRCRSSGADVRTRADLRRAPTSCSVSRSTSKRSRSFSRWANVSPSGIASSASPNVVIGEIRDDQAPDHRRSARRCRAGSRRCGPSRSTSGRRASCAATRCGRRGSSSGPHQCSSQTSSMSCSRRTTTPGSSASRESRSNSFGVSAISSSSMRRRAAPAGRGASAPSCCTPERSDSAESSGAGPPPHGADARDQLPEPERLHDVVVGAELEQEHAIELVAARGEHDDRRVGGSAQCAADVGAVDVGEPEVEQDEVGVVGGAAAPRRRCAPRSPRSPRVRGPRRAVSRWRPRLRRAAAERA